MPRPAERMKPLAVDLFCGLGGWTDGLLEQCYEGYVCYDSTWHTKPVQSQIGFGKKWISPVNAGLGLQQNTEMVTACSLLIKANRQRAHIACHIAFLPEIFHQVFKFSTVATIANACAQSICSLGRSLKTCKICGRKVVGATRRAIKAASEILTRFSPMLRSRQCSPIWRMARDR